MSKDESVAVQVARNQEKLTSLGKVLTKIEVKLDALDGAHILMDRFARENPAIVKRIDRVEEDAEAKYLEIKKELSKVRKDINIVKYAAGGIMAMTGAVATAIKIVKDLTN